MRNLRKIGNQKFQGDLKIQFDSLIVKLENVESLSDASVQTITKTLDVHAPVSKRFQNVRIRQSRYNTEIHEARRFRRKHEKKVA